MNNPISCDFYDQLMVAIQRKIPSNIVYFHKQQNISVKDVVTEITMIGYEEFLILKRGQKINLQHILTFNGKKHKAL